MMADYMQHSEALDVRVEIGDGYSSFGSVPRFR